MTAAAISRWMPTAACAAARSARSRLSSMPGVAILKPELFAGTPDGPFSANLLYDRAIAAGRLYGLRLDGQWLHVGKPQAIPAAEERLAASVR